MRPLHLLAAAALWGLAQAASAAPVTVAPVALSPQFETKLQNDLGVREGAYLRHAIETTVGGALERSGAQLGEGAPITVEITMVNADPNRPTFEQMGRPPFLDYRSFSRGGAELRAVFRAADGHVLREVSHRYYTQELDALVAESGTWSEANKSIQQFARKVALAYREVAAS